MSDFQLQVSFEEPASTFAFPEDITEAHVAIRGPHDCLTLNRKSGRSQLLAPSETVFGPVAGLADWLIEHWGPILWETQTPFAKNRAVDAGVDVSVPTTVAENAERLSEFGDFEQYIQELETIFPQRLEEWADWQHRHLFGHGCSDLALPRIWIIPEDRFVTLIVDSLPKPAGAPIIFLSPDKTPRRPTVLIVAKNVFQAEAEHFIEQTIERAKSDVSLTRWAKWLEDRWIHARTQEKEPKRRFQWMIGELGTKRVLELQQTHPDIALQLEKILLDCPIVRHKSQFGPIEALIEEYVATRSDTTLSKGRIGWRGFGKGIIETNQPDYVQGYHLARLAREKLELKDRPVRDPAEVLDRFSARLEKECESSLFRVALCAGTSGGGHIVPSSTDSRMKSIPGFRFAVLSGLGRLLWQGRKNRNQALCAAQGDYAMISQSRRANAFAVEFLLPKEVIQGLNPDSHQFLALVEDYGISRSAASWHLRNVNTIAYG
ncbi:MAG: ImmA/IrrE family metallo-endopeptidase [Isosphaerales bacterium]